MTPIETQLLPRIEGLLGYAAILAILGGLLHFGIGGADGAALEKSALLVVLGWLVPSLAVKSVPVTPPAAPSAELPEAPAEAPAKKEVM